MVTISFGVPAHNEELNIIPYLESIRTQELSNPYLLKEIIVIPNGCTDKTVEYARAYGQKHSIVKVFETSKKGHTSAVNKMLELSTGDVFVMGSSDTIPEKNMLGELVNKLFSGPMIGAAVGRCVPINDKNTFWGYIAHNTLKWEFFPDILKVGWEGHSAILRFLLKQIPESIIHDEHIIDYIIKKKNYKVIFASNAITYTKQPDNFVDFFRQKRRNIRGHMQIRNLGISAPHIDIKLGLNLLVRNLRWSIKELFWVYILCFLWGFAFLFAYYDYIKNQLVWGYVASGKTISVEMGLKRGA